MKYPASKNKWKFLRQKLQYPLPLESGKSQLEQTKFLCFGKICNVPVFPDRDFLWPFSLLSLCSGDPDYSVIMIS